MSISLHSIVKSYQLYNRAKSLEIAYFYKELNSIDEAINKAALALQPNGKRHRHQCRIKAEVLEKIRNILLQRRIEISQCANFDDLFTLIKKAKIKEFGKLAIYDTAHRIGSYLGIFPDKIYLHAGTLQGARKLKLSTRRGYILIHELPSELQKLEPHEIEDLLCIYKNKL
jgi:hypothetical protein